MLRSLLKISLLVSTLLLISITTPLTARAQSQRVIFTYAAKFVCGKGNEKLVSPGQYFTNTMFTTPARSIRRSTSNASRSPSPKSAPARSWGLLAQYLNQT